MMNGQEPEKRENPYKKQNPYKKKKVQIHSDMHLHFF